MRWQPACYSLPKPPGPSRRNGRPLGRSVLGPHARSPRGLLLSDSIGHRTGSKSTSWLATLGPSRIQVWRRQLGIRLIHGMRISSWIRPLRPFAALTAAATVFACRADNAVQSHRPSDSPIPLLPDSEPVRGHGAIVGVVLDSATREPLAGWDATLFSANDPRLLTTQS